MKETLTPDVRRLLNSWGRVYDRELGYTKPEQFGDIDASYELDIFQDEWSDA